MNALTVGTKTPFIFIQDLFLAKPVGILTVLDEESTFPRVNMTLYYMHNKEI